MSLRKRKLGRGVAVVGVGMTKFGVYPKGGCLIIREGGHPMIKKRVLTVLLLTALLALVACAPVPTTAPTTPTPSPEPALEPAPTPAPTLAPVPEPTPAPTPAPEPEPEEESPEDMQYAANRLFELHNEDVPNFVNKYNVVTYEDEETLEKFLVHEFGFPGGGIVVISRIQAENVAEAKTHIENAHWLANKSKLPTDIRPRDVSTDEIINEVNEALILLKQQEADSYYYEEDVMKWAREHTDPGVNNELVFERIVSTFDAYRGALSKLITKLELVLSKLPASLPVS